MKNGDFDKITITDALGQNAYPGRGIIIGESDSGAAVCAYFIMGRSPNSRNRVFAVRDDALYTEPFDASKVDDPSLIIYAAMKKAGGYTVLTNGDQTDTICAALNAGGTFEGALARRTYEPDAPHYTPRISGIIDDEKKSFELSILKCADGKGGECERQFFKYKMTRGEGRLIHTYDHDGSPLPSFSGEPKRVAICGGIDEFTREIWNALNYDNKISLYVRYENTHGKNAEYRIINKNT